MPAPFIVVFDANVLIPLSLASGRSHSTRLLSRLRAAGHVVALSPQIREEVAEKLRTKKSVRDWMRLSDAEIEQFVADLPAILGIEPLKGNVETRGVVKADPTDDKIIATAVEAGASYIVSEDPHLLDLGEYEGIKILNREQLDTELDRLGVPKGKQKKPR